LCPYFSLSAKTHITGDIGGKTLVKKESPYIVTDNLIVSEGEKTVIEAGTILLFNSFSGIEISGDFYVEGTVEEPVIFTSINDGSINTSAEKLPGDFDWNGIVINKGASTVKMRNFELSYSVYGIKSQKKDVVLINAVFKQNGQFNFTINEDIMMVKDKISYSYDVKEIRKELKRKERPKWKIPVCVGLGAVAVTGVCLAVVGKSNADKYQEKYAVGDSDAVQYKEKRDNAIVLRNVGIICAISGTVGFSVSFFIKK